MNWYKKSNLNIPQILYHATYSHLLRSIKQKGLIPRYFCNWEDCDYGVYLASSEDEARSYAETTENEEIDDDMIDNIIVLKIDTSTLDKNKFDYDPMVRNEDKTTFIYKDIINPGNIK